MSEIRINAGSKELAVERRFVRGIIMILESRYPEFLFKRIEEDHDKSHPDADSQWFKNGYSAEYSLIASGKNDRIKSSLVVTFYTQGSTYGLDDPDRVLVTVSGGVDYETSKPRAHTFSRYLSSNDGGSATFDRNRTTTTQANIVAKVIEKQLIRYDEMKSQAIDNMKQWDAFAARVKRVKKALNIPEKNQWRRGNNQDEVQLVIPETKARQTTGAITISVHGKLDIEIRDMTEGKLEKVVKAFR